VTRRQLALRSLWLAPCVAVGVADHALAGRFADADVVSVLLSANADELPAAAAMVGGFVALHLMWRLVVPGVLGGWVASIAWDLAGSRRPDESGAQEPGNPGRNG
jgi:hypothetical protein